MRRTLTLRIQLSPTIKCTSHPIITEMALTMAGIGKTVKDTIFGPQEPSARGSHGRTRKIALGLPHFWITQTRERPTLQIILMATPTIFLRRFIPGESLAY
jgi:hypothetical protein